MSRGGYVGKEMIHLKNLKSSLNITLYWKLNTFEEVLGLNFNYKLNILIRSVNLFLMGKSGKIFKGHTHFLKSIFWISNLTFRHLFNVNFSKFSVGFLQNFDFLYLQMDLYYSKNISILIPKCQRNRKCVFPIMINEQNPPLKLELFVYKFGYY